MVLSTERRVFRFCAAFLVALGMKFSLEQAGLPLQEMKLTLISL